MTGNENTSGPQPGGRAPAPGRLVLVQDFVNTEDCEGGHDALVDEAAVRAFFQDRALLIVAAARAPGPGQVAAVPAGKELPVGRVHAFRSALRDVISTNNGSGENTLAAEALNDFARSSGVFAGFAADGSPAAYVTSGGVAGALGQLLVIAHEAARQGTWSRLKTCREDSCQWVFYDQSRNRGGAWCSMAVCGSRAKMRQYRRRRASGGSHGEPTGGDTSARSDRQVHE